MAVIAVIDQAAPPGAGVDEEQELLAERLQAGDGLAGREPGRGLLVWGGPAGPRKPVPVTGPVEHAVLAGVAVGEQMEVVVEKVQFRAGLSGRLAPCRIRLAADHLTFVRGTREVPRMARGDALMSPLPLRPRWHGPRRASQLRAARSSLTLSRRLMRPTASRTVSPAAWTRMIRPSRSTLARAIAGSPTAGSAVIVSVTRANGTGSDASRSSDSTFARAN